MEPLTILCGELKSRVPLDVFLEEDVEYIQVILPAAGLKGSYGSCHLHVPKHHHRHLVEHWLLPAWLREQLLEGSQEDVEELL